MEFDHYPEHKKFTLSWTQVEKYIDLMVQSDRYLTDREKEHYTPPAPVSVKPDGAIDRAKKLIREFCQEEYDSEPDFSDLTKIGIAYTHATDEDIPIQVNVDLVGYRVERYLGEVLIDERQYESLEDLTETELEATSGKRNSTGHRPGHRLSPRPVGIPCQTTVAVRREHLPCRAERGWHPPPNQVSAPGGLSAAGHYHPHGRTHFPGGYSKL